MHQVRWRWALVVLSGMALIAAVDPSLSLEAARAEHVAMAHQGNSCCGPVSSCCVEVDAVAVTPAVSGCACCVPTTPTSPPSDGRGVAVESSEVVEAGSVANVTPLAVPIPSSVLVVWSPEIAAAGPPVFLRTCHLRF